jgi:uncharacterized protein YcbX
MTAGKVESLWRYPVKSMRGEELIEAFIGFPGVYGDRQFAFESSAAPKGFPYLTGREQEQMLLFRPVYRHPERMARPGNLADAEEMGATPVYAEGPDLVLDVETPAGERLAIDDPRLIDVLREGIRESHELRLMRPGRAMTDCRPVSLFSIQTARQLSSEVGADLDKRRFRANIYIDLASGEGFGENAFVGRTLQIGAKARVAVTERDPRCKMITLDPESGQPNPEVMRQLKRGHDGKAGVYGIVVVEGIVRPGDEIVVLD